jgi:hypothetical protein
MSVARKQVCSSVIRPRCSATEVGCSQRTPPTQSVYREICRHVSCLSHPKIEQPGALDFGAYISAEQERH